METMLVSYVVEFVAKHPSAALAYVAVLHLYPIVCAVIAYTKTKEDDALLAKCQDFARHFMSLGSKVQAGLDAKK